MHNSGNANQSVATFGEIKKQGYLFKETGPKRWDKSLYCDICKTKTTHSKLLAMDPVFNAKPRITIPINNRTRIIKHLNMRYAFTGGSI